MLRADTAGLAGFAHRVRGDVVLAPTPALLDARIARLRRLERRRIARDLVLLVGRRVDEDGRGLFGGVDGREERSDIAAREHPDLVAARVDEDLLVVRGPRGFERALTGGLILRCAAGRSSAAGDHDLDLLVAPLERPYLERVDGAAWPQARHHVAQAQLRGAARVRIALDEDRQARPVGGLRRRLARGRRGGGSDGRGRRRDCHRQSGRFGRWWAGLGRRNGGWRLRTRRQHGGERGLQNGEGRATHHPTSVDEICVSSSSQVPFSTRPLACFANRASRSCTGPSFGQGQPPKRVLW